MTSTPAAQIASVLDRLQHNANHIRNGYNAFHTADDLENFASIIREQQSVIKLLVGAAAGYKLARNGEWERHWLAELNHALAIAKPLLTTTPHSED